MIQDSPETYACFVVTPSDMQTLPSEIKTAVDIIKERAEAAKAICPKLGMCAVRMQQRRSDPSDEFTPNKVKEYYLDCSNDCAMLLNSKVSYE